MEQAALDALVEALGKRYQLRRAADRAELLYRRGKAEFRETRVFVRADGGLELTVDVRIPRGATAAETVPLVEALEGQSLGPRGFRRVDDVENPMTTGLGEDAGSVRSLRYEAPAAPADELARRIRAIVESIDLPVIVGIHAPEDVIARDPPPPPPKPRRTEPLDVLRFRLASSLTYDLSVFVDPNDRTLRVMERRVLGSRQLGETLKLSRVSRFGVRSGGEGSELVALTREGEALVLATGGSSPEFAATAERMARGARVPFGLEG